MKILMLGWELPPHFVGGMGTVCYSLCEYLAASGADIEFILPFEADYSSIDFMKVNPAQGVTYRDLEKVNATAYGKHNVTKAEAKKKGHIPIDSIHDAYINKIAKLVTFGEYDVIHAHDWLTLRAAMVAKHLSGLPLIVHIHATEFDRSGSVYDGGGDPRIHDIEYMGMMMADKVIAVSERTKSIIVNKYQIDPSKITVVHNRVDLSSPYINGARSSHHNEYLYLERMKELGYTIVANVGRQTIQKGLTHLLEAAKIALEHNPKLLFLFVGSGDQHEELIRLAADLGITENVIFTGFQNGAKLRDAFEIADLFVMPSASEPFGATALEALGLGAPVLISHQSGVSEVLNNALKTDFWDTHAMANKIVAISQNPALIQALHENGLNEFNQQCWSHAALQTHSLYRELVGSVV